MDKYGIKNVTQIKRWMQWYREGQQNRLAQGIGRPHGIKKESEELSEVDRLKRQNKRLKAQLKILKKYQVIQRSWFPKL
jgi:transposase